MKIIMECVPPHEQRLAAYREELYAGDWYFDANGNLHIKVTGQDVFDDPDAFVVALHELVEARLCAKAGVTQAAVDTFDSEWTAEGCEPGDDPAAPYHLQHKQALLIEGLMNHFLRDYK